MAEDDVDFAVAAYHDEGRWQVVELNPRLGEDVDDLSDALGRFPSDVGVLGLVSMNDDFFVILRRSGTQVAGHAVGRHGGRRLALGRRCRRPDRPARRGRRGRAQAVGDLEILSDLGMTAFDLGVCATTTTSTPRTSCWTSPSDSASAAELEAIIG